MYSDDTYLSPLAGSLLLLYMFHENHLYMLYVITYTLMHLYTYILTYSYIYSMTYQEMVSFTHTDVEFGKQFMNSYFPEHF